MIEEILRTATFALDSANETREGERSRSTHTNDDARYYEVQRGVKASIKSMSR